jgi:hypothetical protein
MLAGRDDLAWATVFKNSGPQAGASLEHLHSQLVALDFVPPAIAAELAAARAAPNGFADLVRQAETEGRIVAEEGDLVALVPHAIRQPFETWIVPRADEAWFHAARANRPGRRLQLVAPPGAARPVHGDRAAGRLALAPRDPAPAVELRRLRARHRLPHLGGHSRRVGPPAPKLDRLPK